MNAFFKLTYLFLFLALSLGVLSCEEDEPLPQPQNKLEAKAGADRQVIAGTQVVLDGSASKDGNGKTFSYAWILKSQPLTSSASLSGATMHNPNFTPDVAGEYLVELRITNSLGFATDEVKITALAPGQDPEEPTAIIISEDITEDRVLEDIFTNNALADYIVTAHVAVKAKLTIKPGVRIEFEQDKGLTIQPQGSLIAKGANASDGSTDKSIIFTGRSYTKGFWKGILIASNSPLNEMDYVIVDGAGSSHFGDTFSQATANVLLDGNEHTGAALKVSRSVFSNGAGYGMMLMGMAELNKFENNYFQNNSSSAMYVPARQLHKLDFFSHFTGNNGFNGVETGGTIQEAEHVVWPDFNDGSGYYVSSDLHIKSGVRIAEGATLEFKEGLEMRVTESGYLNATGTEASKITFTARNQSANGYWAGITFSSNSDLNRLHYTEVSYAGSKEVPFYQGIRANIAVALTGKASIENSSISNGLDWGLVAYVDKGARLNANAATANYFNSFPMNHFYKLTSGEATIQQLAGEWFDQTSFRNGYALDDKLYDRATNRWFHGAGYPLTMNPRPGAGLKIAQDGSYIWTIIFAHDPVGSCNVPYSAEYITGNVTLSGNQLQFQENFWRSKFSNPCDTSQDVDTDIDTGSMNLRYEINQVVDVITGNPILELKLFRPDGTYFSYFRH
ncbi:PKD domain-containing protein [Flammeovirgaceae bacterium 311]|nr:PKD domain-containing protein [Flammeovirgaceae bacterium 311]